MSEQTSWITVSPVTEGGSLPPYVIEAGGLIRQTRDLLTADLLHSDGTLAFVYGDATQNYNGIYIKSGGSGTGSWVFTLSLALLLEVGAGGTPTGTTRTVDATSPTGDLSVTEADANGVIFVDGAAGAFNMDWNPDVLPGMNVRFKRDDSSANVYAINIRGEGAITKYTLTADGDWAYLVSKVLSPTATTLKVISSGSTA